MKIEKQQVEERTGIAGILDRQGSLSIRGL